MNCAGFEKLIALQVEGDLPGRKGRGVADHLKICEHCREFAEKLKASQILLKSLAEELVDDAELNGLRARIVNRLETAAEPRPLPVWRYALGAGLAMLLVIAALLIRHRPSDRVVEVAQRTSQQPATEAVVEAPTRPHDLSVPAAKSRRSARRREHFQGLPVAGAKPRQPAQLMVKLVTDDPNVVIYWLID